MRPEHKAFLEGLYRTNFDTLRKYAACVLGDPDLGEEVAQDTFHEAARNIERLATHPNPGGWLMLALKFKIAHCRRDMNRYMLHFISLNTDLAYENRIPSVEDSLPQQTESLLTTIRNALTQEEWTLLRRITLEKATYQTVAKELGITVWACQKRVQRIREKLRRPLEDYL